MEIYIDDMFIKSVNATDHKADPEEMFSFLRKYRMKLNSNKCTFDVSSGKFLGFLVSWRGIEINPEKIKALLD
ncbi:reverse transcriptase domain-containing protein, partial [Mycobacterium kansasii]